VVCVHNLEGVPREIAMTVKHNGEGCVLVNVLLSDHSEANAKGRHSVRMEPYGYRWYRVCGLDYLLKRDKA
jgi:maltose alpha-D-glucosyltransferase/alpha-amylase